MKATLSQMERALPALEQEIQRIATVSMQLKVEVRKDYRGNDYFRIYSDNLAEQLSGLAAPMFEEIHFEATASSKEDSEVMCFSTNVKYQHFGGGTNGTDYIWSYLLFNKETEAWDFENSKLIYNK